MDWWKRIMLKNWDSYQWQENFRVRKVATCLEICAKLAPELQKQINNMRDLLTMYFTPSPTGFQSTPVERVVLILQSIMDHHGRFTHVTNN